MNAPESFDATLDLVVKAREGDRLAFDQLLARYSDRLLTRVRLMMGDEARQRAESADFLQELFVEVIEGFKRVSLKDEREFVRWATQIARNNIRDHVRRRRERAVDSFSTALLHQQPKSGAERPSQQAVRREEIDRLIEGLEGLQPDYQRVIELRDFEQLPFVEIARRMDRPSLDAVQMLHARALAKLTESLG